jgi:hypothetical protein
MYYPFFGQELIVHILYIHIALIFEAYNLNLQLKFEYLFIITCFEVGTLSESKLGFKNLFEELAT